jgi:hypothetical protein
MSLASRALLAGSLLVLAGCGHDHVAAPNERPVPRAPGDWRTQVTRVDRERIRAWRTTWVQADAKVVAAGLGARLQAAGPLLDPDAALNDPTPPPGAYSCRTIKLGTISGGNDYVTDPAQACRIALENGRLSFIVTNGTQRPNGWLFPDTGMRMIFLGAMLLGDETRAMAYGRDSDRDMAGTFERIGPARWRIVLPKPHWEAMLDVIELVPAS